MASKNFSGTLDLPLGSKAARMKWRFTHQKTTGDVIAASPETTELTETGEYNFDLKFGQILIESKLPSQQNWFSHGSVVIDENTTISTLPELLVATNPVTEDVILQMQAILQDARDAEAGALESSIEAQDLLIQTQALVVNKVDKIEGKGLSANDYNDIDKGKVDALGTASERGVTNGIGDLTPASLLSNEDFLSRCGRSDTGWTSVVSLANQWAGDVKYIRRAGFVTVTLSLDGSLPANPYIFNLPLGFRPQFDSVYFQCGQRGGRIGSDGSVVLAAGDSSNRATITFPVI